MFNFVNKNNQHLKILLLEKYVELLANVGNFHNIWQVSQLVLSFTGVLSEDMLFSCICSEVCWYIVAVAVVSENVLSGQHLCGGVLWLSASWKKTVYAEAGFNF